MHLPHILQFLPPLARKRVIYDQFGEEGLKSGVPESSSDVGAWTYGYTFHGNPEKVFRDFFGGDNPFQGLLLFLFVLLLDVIARGQNATFY